MSITGGGFFFFARVRRQPKLASAVVTLFVTVVQLDTRYLQFRATLELLVDCISQKVVDDIGKPSIVPIRNDATERMFWHRNRSHNIDERYNLIRPPRHS